LRKSESLQIEKLERSKFRKAFMPFLRRHE